MSNKRRKKDGGDTMYSPFAGQDDADTRYKLKPTSKVNVSEICQVMAERMRLSFAVRADFADQAGFEPEEYTTKLTDEGKRKVPVFELDDVWDEYHVHAALAHVLFWGFPKLVQANYNEVKDLFEIEVLDKEKFDTLDEGVVNEAFLVFSQQRGGTQNTLLANS